jgi:hypothetical protein
MLQIYNQFNLMFRSYGVEIFSNFNMNLSEAIYSNELIIENGFRIYGKKKLKF